MQKLVEAQFENDPEKRQRIIEDTMKTFSGLSREQVIVTLDHIHTTDKVFINDTYQVNVRKMSKSYHGCPVIHLSIKRRDKEIIHDWRDLQEIKNQICGEECEAVELYPAQSRTVDTANQYHLWCILDPYFRFPFGFNHGAINYESGRDSKQRPKEK